MIIFEKLIKVHHFIYCFAFQVSKTQERLYIQLVQYKYIIMKRRQPNNFKQSSQQDSFDANSSNLSLEKSPQKVDGNQLSNQKLLEHQKNLFSKGRKQGLDLIHRENYQPAKYSKAVQYKNLRSYLKKLPNGTYSQISIWDSTEQLQYFGLGVYFYIEFYRRISWLLFFMLLLVIITVVINWMGSGMNTYTASFSTYLMKSTVGNYSENSMTSIDGYIVTIIPAAYYLAIFIFYLIWKGHHYKLVSKQEKDNLDIKPQKFCIQITDIENLPIHQDELSKYFSLFGQVYQVSLVKRHKNKLSYFERLEELQQKVNEEQLEVILGGGDKQRLDQYKQQKKLIEQEIETLQIKPKIISAFIHFQFQKSKVDCLNHYNDYYSFDTCNHSFARSCCCCCINQPQQKYLFRGRRLLAKNEKVPSPSDVNWQSFQISFWSKFFRRFLAILLVLIILAISLSIIGLCSIYISSHASDCQDVVVPKTVAQALASTNSVAIQCYCDANLVASFTDNSIKNVCSSYLTNIYVSQAIQYAVIIISGLTNFLFGLIVDKIVNFVRPSSKSSSSFTKTCIYTLFLIINTIIVPLIITADIFGFQSSRYISFLTLLSSDLYNFFQVNDINYYADFSTVWYKNVGVIFINYLIANTITVWAFFFLDKWLANKGSLQKQQGKILQKRMNSQITDYKLDIYKEAANFYMILVMCCLFSSGMPILIFLSFINLASRYITNRSLLQANSSKIDGLGEQFMDITFIILPMIVIICPLVGQWMLISNSDIYPKKLSMEFPVLIGYFSVLDKQLYLPFYILISLMAFFQFFLYNTFIRFISCICGLCYGKKEVHQQYHAKPFSQYAKGMNILYSYNIKNNDQMKNVVLNLQKFIQKKEAKLQA